MRKKTLFAVMTVALCAIVAAGGLLASNMGFKLNYRLQAAAGGISATGNNSLALPYFRQTGMNDALQLMQDIGPSGTINATFAVSRLIESADTLGTYTGRMGSPLPSPFALVAGEGYLVRMNAGQNVNYIVVGSHDPSTIIALESSNGGSSITGNNLISAPYNVTAANALQLMQDIGGGSITPVFSVSKLVILTDTLGTYTGRMGSPLPNPFVLQPGEAYFVRMNSTVPYTPSHY